MTLQQFCTIPYRFSVALLGFVCLLVWSCSDSSQQQSTEQPPATNTCTMIFMDKSVSVHLDQGFARKKYTQLINEIIDKNINWKGDRLEVYFIHENTAKGKVLALVARSEMETSDGANANDLEALKNAFSMDLQKERAVFKQYVLKQLVAQNAASSKNSTDIQAALPLIDNAAAKGLEVKAYFLSDMVESMKGEHRRDFHNNPPADDAAAMGWAREDASILKTQLTHLGNVQISIAKPFEPTASTKVNNPAVSTYWQTLLSELGIGTTVEEL